MIMGIMAWIKREFTKEERKRIAELEAEVERLHEQALDLHMALLAAEDDGEKCPRADCNGEMLPMYEEHPNWIQFCRVCDLRYDASEPEVMSEHRETELNGGRN